MHRVFAWLWPLLAVAAAAQLLRYVTLVLNRSRPIPLWWDWASLGLLWLCGYLALAGVIVGLVYFGRWLVTGRQTSYAAVGASDPRRGRLIVVLTVFFPVLAPLFLLEPARAVGGEVGARAERAITKAAVAWGLVCLVALVALVYRIVAASNHSVQTGADSVLWAVLAFAASAVFVRWLRPRLDRLLATTEPEVHAPERRLVIAA